MSAEQQARDLLESCGVESAQSFSAGDVVVLANYVAERDELASKLEGLRREHLAFTSRLGFGDGVCEPAATLAEMVDPIESAFTEGRDHQECPRTCEQCGETLAHTQCPECHGSGCNAPLCEASGAYAECEQCGGSGWLHDGCAELSYADLVAEIEKLRRAAKTLGKIIDDSLTDVLKATDSHDLIGEDGDGDWMVVFERLMELRPARDVALAEVERLRAGGPWVEHIERMNAMKRTRDGDCICDRNPETTDGPDEFCPWDGRPYREVVGILESQAAEIAQLRAQRNTETVTATTTIEGL